MATPTVSPKRSSGTAKTAASAIDGCLYIAASTSAE